MNRMLILLISVLCCANVGHSKSKPKIEKMDQMIETFFHDLKFQKYDVSLKNLLIDSKLYKTYIEDKATNKILIDSLMNYKQWYGSIEGVNMVFQNLVSDVIHRIYFCNYERGVVKFEFLIYLSKIDVSVLDIQYDDKLLPYFANEMNRKLRDD